jgi:hypothetical protein
MHWSQIILVPFEVIFIGVLAFIAVSVGERFRVQHYRFPHLSKDERIVLETYINRDVKTIPWTVADALPKSLFSEGILYKSHDTGRIEKGFTYYTIHDWAFRYLKTNKKRLLGI